MSGRTGRSGSAVWWVAGGVIAAGALALNFAGALHIERLPLMAGIVGPRNALTVLAAASGLLLLVLALALRPARRVVLPAALALLLVTGLSTSSLVGRGVLNPVPAAFASTQLRVLSWNINGDLVSPTVIARLAERERANVVVLPEIDQRLTGDGYARAFSAAHLAMTAYPSISDTPQETVVFVADSLGGYNADVGHGPQPYRSAVLTSAAGKLPTIVALHAAHPTLNGNDVWNAELDWVQRACRSDDVIAVGDFNATIDSFGSTRLGRCRDAATLSGSGGIGTWPTAAPDWAGMSLDHVLVSPGWKVQSFSVLTSEIILEHGIDRSLPYWSGRSDGAEVMRNSGTRPPRAPSIDRAVLDDSDPDRIGPDDIQESQRFTKAELGGRDLSGAAFRDCEFIGADFDETQLRSSRFVGTRIQRMNAPVLRAAHSSWRDVWIQDSRIGSGELYDTALQSVTFRSCKLGYLNLRGSKIEDLHFVDCSIEEVDLVNSKATRVAFTGSELGRLDISRAQLEHFDLRELRLHAIDGIDALRGVTISEAQLAEFAPLLAAGIGLRVEG